MEEVFDRCIQVPNDKNIKDPKLKLDFYFEFLDDTYAASSWGNEELVDVYCEMSKYDYYRFLPQANACIVTECSLKVLLIKYSFVIWL